MILRVASSRIRTVGTCLGFPGFLTSSAQRVPRAIPPIYCQSPGSGKTARRCLVSTSKPTTGGWRASLDRFLAAKEMPPRNTFAWYREMLLICTVFAITGSSTMIVSLWLLAVLVNGEVSIFCCVSKLLISHCFASQSSSVLPFQKDWDCKAVSRTVHGRIGFLRWLSCLPFTEFSWCW